jgi:CBS domain-containing protein
VTKHQQLLVAVAKTSVSEAARLMEKHKVGAVMVVDARGQLSGIFTERDALFCKPLRAAIPRRHGFRRS